MVGSFLKQNDDKTELVVSGPPKRIAKIQDFELSVGINKAKPSPYAQNLGVHFEISLSFKSFVR